MPPLLEPIEIFKKHLEPLDPVEYYTIIASIGVLVIVGGIVAGLTIGLLSLDETQLTILKASGTEKEKKCAERIEPIRKNTHLLLVTLLLTNTVINETLPILFDAIHLTGYKAVLGSTLLILIFGEIIPQSVCARYGLTIGAFFAWPVRILISLLWVISYPISKLLDWLLGAKHGVMYRRQELRELMALHGQDQSGPLTQDEVSVLRAVLELRDKTVGNIMTHLEDVFMLSLDACLDPLTIQQIVKAGHSRVPVYYKSTDNIVGLVLVKELILVEPNTSLSSLKIRKTPIVPHDTALFDMLHVFQTGGSHMAIVVKPYDDSLEDIGQTVRLSMTNKQVKCQVIGIVTLEDVIEELLGQEIIDETDVYVDMHQEVKVVRTLGKLSDMFGYFTPKLGPEESRPLLSPKLSPKLKRKKRVQELVNTDRLTYTNQDDDIPEFNLDAS